VVYRYTQIEFVIYSAPTTKEVPAGRNQEAYNNSKTAARFNEQDEGIILVYE